MTSTTLTKAGDLNTDPAPKQFPPRHRGRKHTTKLSSTWASKPLLATLGALAISLVLTACEQTPDGTTERSQATQTERAESDKNSMVENPEKSKSDLPEGINRCPEQRPEMCTQQYDPACGYFDPKLGRDSVSHTFGNSCTACTYEEVIGFIQGECPD